MRLLEGKEEKSTVISEKLENKPTERYRSEHIQIDLFTNLTCVLDLKEKLPPKTSENPRRP